MMWRIIVFSLLLFILTGCQVAQTPHANCALKGKLTVTHDTSGDIKFLGEIDNSGNRRADYVKMTFTLKNSAGNVLETPYTYVNNTNIEVGKTDSFTCYTNTSSKEVASYPYTVSWDEF